MLMNTPHYLTQAKFEELKKELEQARTVRRLEVAKELEYAKGLGDLSENAEYQQAREMQMNLEERISQLEVIIKDAAIVNEKSGSKDAVSIGSKVTVSKKGQSEQMTYVVVGSEEADVSTGRLSISSPLAEAMLGKKKGESFKVATPKGATEYVVVAIM